MKTKKRIEDAEQRHGKLSKIHTAYELLESPGNFEFKGSTLTEKEIKRFAESLPASDVLIKVKWVD
jgi:hypothetical protein